MIEIGRICIKLAGRDARKRCVIVDVLDKNYVLIDGETRRRKCNILHLEPLNKVVDIKKGAEKGHLAELWKKEFGVELKITKKKEQKPRPKKQKVKKDRVKEKKEKPSKKLSEPKENKASDNKEIKKEKQDRKKPAEKKDNSSETANK